MWTPISRAAFVFFYDAIFIKEISRLCGKAVRQWRRAAVIKVDSNRSCAGLCCSFVSRVKI